jgi:hypothetical protein
MWRLNGTRLGVIVLVLSMLTACPCETKPQPGVLLIGHPDHVVVATSFLGVGGIKTRQNVIPEPNEVVLFTVSTLDGPMPQTAELITFIKGKQHGSAAIFMVNAYAQLDPDLRQLVLLEIKDLLKKNQQPGVDTMPVIYDDQPTALEQVRKLATSNMP